MHINCSSHMPLSGVESGMKAGQGPSSLDSHSTPAQRIWFMPGGCWENGGLSTSSLAWLQFLFHSLMAGDGSKRLGSCGVKVYRDTVRRSLEGGLDKVCGSQENAVQRISGRVRPVSMKRCEDSLGDGTPAHPSLSAMMPREASAQQLSSPSSSSYSGKGIQFP